MTTVAKSTVIGIEVGTIMDRLKAETAEQHTYAETRALQKAMATGTVSREAFTRYMGQLLVVHGALERELDTQQAKAKSGAGHEGFTKAYNARQKRAEDLRIDLAAHGVSAEVAALPATSAFVKRIETWGKEHPAALLGVLYVLDGSMNGNKFLAKALSRAFGVKLSADGGPAEAGLRYLDPYGAKQREFWLEFRADMNACAFSEPEKESILGAAKETFSAVAEISDAANRG